MHLTDMAHYLDASTRRQQRRTTSHTTKQFGKPLNHRGRLPPVEGLAFLVDSRAIAHDPDLRRITDGAILAARPPQISKNSRERHQLRRPKMLLKSSSNPATTRPEPSRRFCVAPMMDWTYFY
ncbi:hypothetical protein [Azotobacter chroococcum]